MSPAAVEDLLIHLELQLPLVVPAVVVLVVLVVTAETAFRELDLAVVDLKEMLVQDHKLVAAVRVLSLLHTPPK